MFRASRFAGMATVLLSLALSDCAWAQSHCQPHEYDYFSCRVKHSHKVISLCGSEPADLEKSQSADSSWLQYRFGPLGRPELTFPKQKRGSVAQFSGEFHQPYQGVYYGLSFENEGANYTLINVNADTVFVGVWVDTAQGHHISVACAKNQGLSAQDRFAEIVYLLEPTEAH